MFTLVLINFQGNLSNAGGYPFTYGLALHRGAKLVSLLSKFLIHQCDTHALAGIKPEKPCWPYGYLNKCIETPEVYLNAIQRTEVSYQHIIT